ncbi:MAG: GNAT family N-acetyltransferase [Pyrinomonadaceae bacterium]
MTPSENEIKKRFGKAGEIWIAALDSEIIGTVSVVHHNEALYIRSPAILSAAQGLRIGELLLRDTENYAVVYGDSRF